ncbi:MAG: hypothetical protein ACR2JE_09240 [Acidobacteriaceae bacterium]
MTMRVSAAALAVLLLSSIPVHAQPASAPTTAPAPGQSMSSQSTQNAMVLGDSLNALQPAMDGLHQTLASLNVSKWKAPGDVRGQAQSDIDSMQRDLNGTLPDLLAKARSANSSVSPSFAVFRNVDALYDVMLRVTETATLAGAQRDAGQLEQSRAMLEHARAQLGTALLQQSQAQDAEVVQLRTTAAAAAAAVQQAAPKKTVVDDGPVTTKAKPRRKRPAPAPSTQAAPQ